LQQNFEFAVVLSLYIFEHKNSHLFPTSYIYVAHICISLSKLQSVLHKHYKDH